jgi:hypothetical protein
MVIGLSRRGGGSGRGRRGSRWPGAAQTACRSPCRRCRRRRTARRCRGGRSRSRAARVPHGITASAWAVRWSPLDQRFLIDGEDRRVRRGARQRPTTPRILPRGSGSGETFRFSARCGCGPNDRQMRCTLVGEIPVLPAGSPSGRRGAPPGTSSGVRTITSSTWPSVVARALPGAACRAARPAAGPDGDRAAAGAQPRSDGRVGAAFRAGRHDLRPQRLTPHGAPAPDQSSRARPSSSDRAGDANLDLPSSPGQRTAAPLSPPGMRSETEPDSGDDRELRTGPLASLDRAGRRHRLGAPPGHRQLHPVAAASRWPVDL